MKPFDSSCPFFLLLKWSWMHELLLIRSNQLWSHCNYDKHLVIFMVMFCLWNNTFACNVSMFKHYIHNTHAYLENLCRKIIQIFIYIVKYSKSSLKNLSIPFPCLYFYNFSWKFIFGSYWRFLVSYRQFLVLL